MRVRCGTSGYSYKEWKGHFYPEDLPATMMLQFYAEHLPTVEINNTFYRIPRPEMVASWSKQVPPSFRFVIKAPRRITHVARLKNCEAALEWTASGVAPLGARLGLVLFQMPPNSKRDVVLLRDFLTVLPPEWRVAFEFRNPSWFQDETYRVLEDQGAALVGGDLDAEDQSPPLIRTAPFGYLRLRRSDYTDSDLEAWAARIAESGWDEVYAFFKHEHRGPEFADRLNVLGAAGRATASSS